MVTPANAPQERGQSYSEKLRDPRWQRRRLEILSRDNFACVLCEDENSTLHVHHCYYNHDLDPWEYPAESLLTLCAECHGCETIAGKEGREHLLRCLSERGLMGCDLDGLAYDLCLFAPTVQRRGLLEALRFAIRSLEANAPDGESADA